MKNRQEGVWIIDGSLPEKNGEYFVMVRHKNDSPEAELTSNTVDFHTDLGWGIGKLQPIPKDWIIVKWFFIFKNK